MRIIPVIDILHGQVVRGVGGRRHEYRPIHSPIAVNAQPGTTARALVERFGFDTAYVADLDAIMRGKLSLEAWQQITSAGLKIWLDAGAADSPAASQILTTAKESNVDCDLVIGLESLASCDQLTRIQQLCGRTAIFSLDLQGGKPLTRLDAWKAASPLKIAAEAIDRGTQRLIVLDLADVGEGGGTRTLQLCRDLRRNYPDVELIAGGGVRGGDDLNALADAGCNAALVASALHDGRLTAEDIRRVAALV